MHSDLICGARNVRIAEVEAENKRWKEWHSRSIDEYRELRLLRVENQRLTLKLLYIEEWFDNILPDDWDMCMRRWEER